jgi:hypothetical protein
MARRPRVLSRQPSGPSQHGLALGRHETKVRYSPRARQVTRMPASSYGGVSFWERSVARASVLRVQRAARQGDRDVAVTGDEDQREAPCSWKAPAAIGKVKWNVAPRIALLVTQMLPPWASMIEWAIARPMPMPADFVV